MASKYVGRLVANTANINDDLHVGGTLYTANVNGDGNFGIQMNIENFDGNVTSDGNLIVENMFGNVEIDTYSGNLDQFTGDIGTIENMGNINGNVTGNINGGMTVNGAIAGGINGNVHGGLTTRDYTNNGNVGTLSYVTIGGDFNLNGNVENYNVDGDLNDMEITGDPTITIGGNVSGYIVNGNVESIDNIAVSGNFTVNGTVTGNVTAEPGSNVTITGNIVSSNVNMTLDSNVIDLGAVIRLNTGALPVEASGIVVANIDGDAASITLGTDGGWVFTSIDDSVTLTATVEVDNGITVGSTSPNTIDADDFLPGTTTYMTVSSPGNELVVVINNPFDMMVIDIVSVALADGVPVYLSAKIAGPSVIFGLESTDADVVYEVLPNADGGGDIVITNASGTIDKSASSLRIVRM